jgi:hypothetical protein
MTLSNAAPKIIFDGIRDGSRGTLAQEPETFAQHTPLLRLFAQSGPTHTIYPGQNFTGIFGTETLNRRSPYFNTQSLLAETLLGEGNGFFVKRLVPEDAAPPARITLAIDIVADEIPKTVGRLDGFDYPQDGSSPDDVVLDVNGEPEMVMGYRARLVLLDDNVTAVGQQSVMDGSFVANADGTQSTMYPLMELPASFFGDGGNLNGLRMWAPTMVDALPMDEETTQAFKTRMYRMQFMKRNTPDANPVSVRTIRDEEYVDICFTPGVYSSSSDREFYAPDVLIDQYEDDGLSSGFPPRFSPFEQIHVYQENLETVQAMVYASELTVNPAVSTAIEAAGQMDIFSGIDFDGYRHMSLLLEGPLMGGVHLGRDNTIYAQGGSDGTMDHEMYERLVTRENLNFGQLGDQYENMNIYPFTQVYDTGLSMDCKFAMMNVLAGRHDLRTVFTTFVEADGRAPLQSEELSRTQALMARLRGFPESVLYSTGVCRAEIILQTGRLASGNYTKPVPQILDYAQRWAQFAGAATGIMREGADIDVHPNNRIRLVNRLNVEYFNQRTQADLWENGGTYSLSYDRRSQYYPAIKSVYADDTSVLLSPITVSIACDAIRVVNRVHAHFSGNATLTRSQLIERCDALILSMTNNRYNDRVILEPETYFTDADNQRGFSWHCRLVIRANNPFTVMIFDLETRRMEDI